MPPHAELAMPAVNTERHRDVYKVVCDDGRRYLVYNASVIGNPADHVPDRWYFWRYDPVPLGFADHVSGPFDTAEGAERAAWRNRS
jgi:hypothetical protein